MAKIHSLTLFVPMLALAAGCTQAIATSPAASRPTVEIVQSAADAKDVFSLDLYEPWSGAGHRILYAAGASVTPSGFASLATTRANDTGLGGQPVEIWGENHRCIFRPLVATWAEVQDKTQVETTILRKD
jgi:hypothetical protein